MEEDGIMVCGFGDDARRESIDDDWLSIPRDGARGLRMSDLRLYTRKLLKRFCSELSLLDTVSLHFESFGLGAAALHSRF